MKYLFILCALAVGVAFASETDLGHIGPYATSSSIGGFPGTDDVIVSQPYSFAGMVNGLGCSGGNSWMIADDFTPAGSATMGIINYWVLYTGSQATGWKYEIRNNGTGPGTTVLWTQDVTGVVNTSTGLYGWGYLVYNALCTLTPAQYYTPVAGTKVWLCFQSSNGSGVTYFTAANQTWAQECFFSQNNGSSWASSTASWGVPYELFMIVSTPVSLERDTWGSIKTSF